MANVGTLSTEIEITTKPRGRKAPAKPTPISVTSASAWNATALYQLPSGNIAKLRRPGVLATAATVEGRNLVSDAVLVRSNVTSETPTTEAERAELIRKNAAIYITAAKLAFVSPRVVDEPDYDNDEIAPGDLHDDDLFWVYYEFVQAGAAHAAEFRVG